MCLVMDLVMERCVWFRIEESKGGVEFNESFVTGRGCESLRERAVLGENSWARRLKIG
jgi:hypothetical protein